MPSLHRESVIDISSRALSDNRLDAVESMGDPDYKNLSYNEDGSLTFDPDDGEAATPSFNEQIKILGNIVAGGSAAARKYENTRVPNVLPDHLSEDYMNDYPEGLEHTYSNQDDLLQQVRGLSCVGGTP